MTELERAISSQRKRRGVVRGSITRLQTKIRGLEARLDDPDTPAHGRRILQKLSELDSDFKTQHFALIDLIEKDEDLEREQEILDRHDEEIAQLVITVERLLSACAAPPTIDSNGKRLVLRKLERLKRNLQTVTDAVDGVEPDAIDVCFLQQLEDDLIGYKMELREAHSDLLALSIDELDDSYEIQSSLESIVFDTSLKIRKLLHVEGNKPQQQDGRGVKLPKISVPQFNGDILSWKVFWEQFSVSVHDRTNLSPTEKLAYLRHSLNQGSAKHVIEGLSQTGDCYKEAVECLQARYNRPRLIHQTHVRMIMDAAPLKDGNGKEIRRLHDVVQQHLCALKAMDHEPSGPIITSMLELKLDPTTLFEWQKCSQEETDVPHYQKLLDFLDLRAQALEVSVAGSSPQARSTRQDPSSKKGYTGSKSIASYAVSTTDQSPNCIACKRDKHPLYLCAKIQIDASCKQDIVIEVKQFVFELPKPGHFVNSCKSLHRCRVCQKPHHSLLHVEAGPSPATSTSTPTVISEPPSINPVASHTASGLGKSLLLMTCQLLVESPEGHMIQVRALLDSASSASFLFERLAQTLRLNRSTCNVRISGIAGLSHSSSAQSMATFNISSIYEPEKKISLSAIVVPRVTCDLPVVPNFL